jgi:hypothetical protein
MTLEQIAKHLSIAAKNAFLQSKEIASLMKILADAGKRAEINIYTEIFDLEPTVSDADADFLRGLRIAPDLEVHRED